MRTNPFFRLIYAAVAVLAVSCRPVIFEVHPCDDLAQKIGEAADYSRQNPGSRVSVRLTGGVYRLSGPVSLDSLGGPFTITAVRGARPVIAGDVDIVDWTPSSLGEGVFEASIAEGIDLGAVAADSNRVDFYAGDVRQELARWPNGGGFTTAGKCLDPECDNDPVVPDVIHHTNGIMEYTDARMDRWASEKDPYLMGYWCWDWFESYKRLASINTSSHSFTVDPVTDLYGFRDGCRFCGVNLLCELDEEGEYYIDRSGRKIYWKAPAGFFDQRNHTTRLSVCAPSALLNACGCESLTVEGIEFRGFRGGVIRFQECSGSAIKDCYIHCIGEDAVVIEGGKKNKVKGCRLCQLGKRGVVASGGDRKTLDPADFKVKKCEFSDFALFRHTYNPAIRFDGVGALIRRCRFSNSTSSAISTGGNDIVIERCRFSDLVKESDDQGAIESYGDYAFRRCIVRYNRFTDICHGTKYGSAAVRFDDIISGNEVYGNVFKRCGSMKFGAVQIHGGRDNRVHHNIFVDCNYSISCSPWTPETLEFKLDRLQSRWADIDLTGEPYVSRYPELREPTDSLNQNRNYFQHNLSIRSKEEMFRGDYLVTKGNIDIK